MESAAAVRSAAATAKIAETVSIATVQTKARGHSTRGLLYICH